MRAVSVNLILTVTLMPLALAAQPDSTGLVPKLEIVGLAGKISAHHEEMKPMCDKPFFAGELRLGMQTTGSEAWHQLFKYPYMGIGFYASEFQKSEIGHPMALFGFMELPAYRSRNLTISTNWSAGVSFNINKFDSVRNPSNLAIGSRINAYIEFGLYCKYKASERVELGTGLTFQHFSNGAIKQPNWGMNMLAVNLVASYLPTNKRSCYRTMPIPEITKRYEFNLMYAGGIRDDQKGGHYYNSTLSAALSRRMNLKRTLGLGIDVFYNEYLKEDYNEPDNVPTRKLISYAVFANSDMVAGRIRINIGLGTYAVRSKDYTLPIYERAGLRYYITRQLFANVSIKAHAAKAEFIEWGVGVTL